MPDVIKINNIGNVLAEVIEKLVSSGLLPANIPMLSGESYLHLFAGLETKAMARSNLKLVGLTDEALVGAYAMGLAKSSEKLIPSICMVTREPGLANLHPVIDEAKQANTPLIILAGQVPTSRIGLGLTQEIIPEEYSNKITVIEITEKDPIKAVKKLLEAYISAIKPVPKPVLVLMPSDILAHPLDTDDEYLEALSSGISAALAEFKEKLKQKDKPNQSIINSAAQMIGQSNSPIIIGGHIVSSTKSHAAFNKLATDQSIGVISEFRNQEVTNTNDPNKVGCASLSWNHQLKSVFAESDLVIICGRPEIESMENLNPYLFEGKKVIHINLDDDYADSIRRNEKHPLHYVKDEDYIAITGNVNEVFSALQQATGVLHVNQKQSRDSWLEQHHQNFIEARNNVFTDGLEGDGIDPARFMAAIAEIFPHAIHTTDAGNCMIPAEMIFDKTIAPTNGTMGLSGGFALGAAAASPNNSVFCHMGDGAFFMKNIGAIADAVNQELPINFIVYNNVKHATIYMHARNAGYDDLHATDLAHHNYANIGRSITGIAFRIEQTQHIPELLQYIQELRNNGENRPIVIEVMVHEKYVAPHLTTDDLAKVPKKSPIDLNLAGNPHTAQKQIKK